MRGGRRTKNVLGGRCQSRVREEAGGVDEEGFDLVLQETLLPGRQGAEAEFDGGEYGGGDEVDPGRITGRADEGEEVVEDCFELSSVFHHLQRIKVLQRRRGRVGGICHHYNTREVAEERLSAREVTVFDGL